MALVRPSYTMGAYTVEFKEDEPMKKYRFKTVEEMKNQYGHSWRTSVEMHWTDQMDHLSGLLMSKESYDSIMVGNRRVPESEHYNISKDMVTTGKSKKKKEKTNDKTIYRFKTKEEFMRELGQPRGKGWVGSGEMDKLLGMKISEGSYLQLETSSGRIPESGTWMVGFDDVIKEKAKKSLKDKIKDKKMFKEKYRFKTEKELESEKCPMWRHHVIHGWNDDMDNLLGKKISEESYNSIKSGNMYIAEGRDHAISEGIITIGKAVAQTKIKLSDKLFTKQPIIKLDQNN